MLCDRLCACSTSLFLGMTVWNIRSPKCSDSASMVSLATLVRSNNVATAPVMRSFGRSRFSRSWGMVSYKSRMPMSAKMRVETGIMTSGAVVRLLTVSTPSDGGVSMRM